MIEPTSMNLTTIKRMMYRNPQSHKGQNGKVLIIGGSEEYTGTLILAGLAALRTGCDIVTIVAPEKVAWAINCYSPDLITKKLPGTYCTPAHIPLIRPLIKNHDVILIGNGLGLKNATRQMCRQLMKITRHKLKVIDADAIKMLALQEIQHAVITPHARELQMMLKNSGLSLLNNMKQREQQATELRKHVKNNILLLKGPTDYIISKDKIKMNNGGNPGMARAGMGDVLAGLCAGLLAQTNNNRLKTTGDRHQEQISHMFRSADAASYLNKRLGDLLLQRKKGYCFIASDMLEELRLLKQRL